LSEEEQIVSAARLRVGAAHIEAAEWMDADKRAGAFSVDIQIADVKVMASLFEIAAILRIDGRVRLAPGSSEFPARRRLNNRRFSR